MYVCFAVFKHFGVIFGIFLVFLVLLFSEFKIKNQNKLFHSASLLFQRDSKSFSFCRTCVK